MYRKRLTFVTYSLFTFSLFLNGGASASNLSNCLKETLNHLMDSNAERLTDTIEEFLRARSGGVTHIVDETPYKEADEIINQFGRLIEAKRFDQNLFLMSNKLIGRRKNFKTAGHVGIVFSSDGTLYKLMPKKKTKTFLNEVYFSHKAQGMGGPKIQSFGKVKIEGDEHFFIQMDDVFHDEPRASMKGILMYERPQEIALIEKYYTSKVQNVLINNLSSHYIKLIREGIEPLDPDFIINKSGLVRWIDFGHWRKVQNIEDTMDTAFHIGKKLEKIFPKLKGEFLKLLRQKIRASKDFSEAEKSALLQPNM